MQRQRLILVAAGLVLVSLPPAPSAHAPRVVRPVLHGRHCTLTPSLAPWVRRELRGLGCELELEEVNSGPLNAIFFDREHGTMWGGSAIHGEDYGIAW